MAPASTERKSRAKPQTSFPMSTRSKTLKVEQNFAFAGRNRASNTEAEQSQQNIYGKRFLTTFAPKNGEGTSPADDPIPPSSGSAY